MKLFGAVTSVHLDTVVEDKQEYVRSGVSHVVLRVANVTYQWVEATPDDLPSEQWYELLSTGASDVIAADIEKRGDIWTIIGFDNLDIP
jgi:hypothetical protein